MSTQRKSSPKTPGKKRVRRLSRADLETMFFDIVERINQQAMISEAIATLVKPNGEHTLIEYQTRTAFGLMVESQKRALRDIVVAVIARGTAA